MINLILKNQKEHEKYITYVLDYASGSDLIKYIKKEGSSNIIVTREEKPKFKSSLDNRRTSYVLDALIQYMQTNNLIKTMWRAIKGYEKKALDENDPLIREHGDDLIKKIETAKEWTIEKMNNFAQLLAYDKYWKERSDENFSLKEWQDNLIIKDAETVNFLLEAARFCIKHVKHKSFTKYKFIMRLKNQNYKYIERAVIDIFDWKNMFDVKCVSKDLTDFTQDSTIKSWLQMAFYYLANPKISSETLNLVLLNVYDNTKYSLSINYLNKLFDIEKIKNDIFIKK